MAVGVGSRRGSAVNRLRPVGSTSRRPRCGAPAGPAFTRLPSSAVSRALALGLRACLPQWIVARRRAAEDMQPILDGEVFQVAEPGIDLAQRLVGIELGRHASLARQPRALRGLDDQPRQTLAAAAIQPVGDGIFIDQALELLRGAAELGVYQRRRQMTDGHGGDATLGLRRFSRIADEERIEHGQRADDRLRET